MRRRGVIKISSDAFEDFDEEPKKEEVVIAKPEPKPEEVVIAKPEPKPEEKVFDAKEASFYFEDNPVIECRNCGAQKELKEEIDYDSFITLVQRQKRREPIVDALTMECECFFKF